eukprot:m.192982 g.192982  ORF g.192982 m.192982 type:complete len:62 (-) comp53672_c0_seq4:1063-1248(-)
MSASLLRSCYNTQADDHRSFILFEGICLAIAVLSSIAVRFRMNKLNMSVYTRLQRQIGNIV